jgi:hypothetical protein
MLSAGVVASCASYSASFIPAPGYAHEAIMAGCAILSYIGWRLATSIDDEPVYAHELAQSGSVRSLGDFRSLTDDLIRRLNEYQERTASNAESHLKSASIESSKRKS